MPGFADHFSSLAEGYAAFRPPQSDDVIDYVASLPARRALVWDCGTGNGQAAVGLARHFERVVATDASTAQIAHARPHARISYVVASAERSAVRSQVADLVTVAQALHWFDLEQFFAEVRRVAAPGAAVAVWAYGDVTSDNRSLAAVLHDFTRETVGAYWPPERRIVDDGYRTIPFPFREIHPPSFTLSARWTLPHLIGYLRTWSATAAHMRATGTDAVAQSAPEIAAAWGEPDTAQIVRWPISLRVGFVG